MLTFVVVSCTNKWPCSGAWPFRGCSAGTFSGGTRTFAEATGVCTIVPHLSLEALSILELLNTPFSIPDVQTAPEEREKLL